MTEPNDGSVSFTPRAQQALAFARKEADRLNHHFVGTEHLLLGLIRLGQGVAVTVLQRLGLDLETVREEVERQVGKGPEQELVGNIPYTPHLKKVLAVAAREAKALSHMYVGTEHILLGLLCETEGGAARVFKSLKADVEATRKEILRELDPNLASASGAPESSPSPAPTKPQGEVVDTSKRYDVYCSERSQKVVYRNALFKGLRHLFRRDSYDPLSEFLELEQADGQTVFVSRASVVKFCEPGLAPGGGAA